jgi:hypothetical protein
MMTAEQLSAHQHSGSRFDGTGKVTGAIDLHEKSPLNGRDLWVEKSPPHANCV